MRYGREFARISYNWIKQLFKLLCKSTEVQQVVSIPVSIPLTPLSARVLLRHSNKILLTEILLVFISE